MEYSLPFLIQLELFKIIVPKLLIGSQKVLETVQIIYSFQDL